MENCTLRLTSILRKFQKQHGNIKENCFFFLDLFRRISGGELFEKVCNDDNLTEKEVVRYMKQILQGVEHMHKKRIVHLDLKVRDGSFY